MELPQQEDSASTQSLYRKQKQKCHSFHSFTVQTVSEGRVTEPHEYLLDFSHCSKSLLVVASFSTFLSTFTVFMQTKLCSNDSSGFFL